ncbi:hypothetical protein [uncultured Bacteroides sp.]|uniref:hypothetical protein n=1 Tax=uncultured Bacteroides sp. TaxID=162156 RepID=UPI002620B8E6|nr:hypothetical protein [uncultured Bacteroides sp.]
MKRILMFFLFGVMFFQIVNAQIDSINDESREWEQKYNELQTRQERAEDEIRILNQYLNNYQCKVQKLINDNSLIHTMIDSMLSENKNLRNQQLIEQNKVNDRIDATNNSVRVNQTRLQKQAWWGIGWVLVILVSIIVVIYWFIKKIKIGSSSIDEVRKVQDTLQSAQMKMQEESLKLDNKLLELAEKQMEATPTPTGNTEIDHSLALKVADEIVRIELNMSRMDPSIKGYKQLAKAVQRIKDNFMANGYEIVDMLGKPYNEGMKVTANFIPDENLEQGRQIISGITKPQVNYNGTMIQAAQITVSQNI